MDPKEKQKRIKEMLREKRAAEKIYGPDTMPFYIIALCVIAMMIVVLSGSNSKAEYRVMTSQSITVQEKTISGSTYNLVLSNGEETYTLPVSASIYDSYQPGDSYRHDADQKNYDE